MDTNFLIVCVLALFIALWRPRIIPHKIPPQGWTEIDKQVSGIILADKCKADGIRKTYDVLDGGVHGIPWSEK